MEKWEREDAGDSRPLPFLFALNKQVWGFFIIIFFFPSTLADICTNVFSQRVKEEKDERYQTFNVSKGWGGGKRQRRERKTVKTFGSQQRVCSLAGLQISKLSGVSGGGVSCLEHQPTCLNKAPCRDKRYPREGNINWGLTVYGIKNKKNPLAGGYNTRQLQVMLEIRRGGHNEGEKRKEREREKKMKPPRYGRVTIVFI